MSNLKKRSDFLLTVLFTSGQEDEKSMYELVHSCNHSLSMRESAISLLVVISIEDGIPIDTSLSHKKDIFPKTGIATLGDVTMPLTLAGLVYAGICSHEIGRAHV